MSGCSRNVIRSERRKKGAVYGGLFNRNVHVLEFIVDKVTY